MERMAIELTFERAGKEYVEHSKNNICNQGYNTVRQ